MKLAEIYASRQPGESLDHTFARCRQLEARRKFLTAMGLIMLVAILLGAALALSGCATAPGGTTPVGVAQRTIAETWSNVDAFLQWEDANPSVAGPQVHAFAEQLRREYPAANQAAWAALDAYRAAPTTNTLQRLDGAVRVLQEILTQVQQARPPTQAGAGWVEGVLALLSAISLLKARVESMIAAAKARGELTPEAEQQIRAEQIRIMATSPHWQPGGE
jgi:hypothetical protein